MIKIKKYKKKELLDYIQSEEYNSLPIIPISKARALSYINNLNSDDEDVVLYIAYQEKKIVGFRTIFADKIRGNNSPIKVGWLSGNWVDDSMRRQGISSLLFREVYSDWVGKLIYTNYAPESKAVYDKTSSFFEYSVIEGYRYYMKSPLVRLLSHRHPLFKHGRFFLQCIDWIANRIISLRKIHPPKTSVQIVSSNKIDNETINFIVEQSRKGLSARNNEIFNYIFHNPWLFKEKSKPNSFYPFSGGFSDLQNLCLISRGKNGVNGFAQVYIRNNIATIPFYFGNDDSNHGLIKEIEYLLISNNVDYFTTRNKVLIEAISKTKLSFIAKKKMPQGFYASQTIRSEIADSRNILFQDGEGDVAFV